MAKKTKAKEATALQPLLRQWQALEETTIEYSTRMLRRSKNPLVQMVMQMVKLDSQKHKVILGLLQDALGRQALHLSPEELRPLAEALNAHIQAEAKSIEIAQRALTRSDLGAVRYILQGLLADETKHHSLLADLRESLKRATIFVT
jgi:hypothetical protein